MTIGSPSLLFLTGLASILSSKSQSSTYLKFFNITLQQNQIYVLWTKFDSLKLFVQPHILCFYNIESVSLHKIVVFLFLTRPRYVRKISCCTKYNAAPFHIKPVVTFSIIACPCVSSQVFNVLAQLQFGFNLSTR